MKNIFTKSSSLRFMGQINQGNSLDFQENRIAINYFSSKSMIFIVIISGML